MRTPPQPPTGQRNHGRGNEPGGTQPDRQSRQDARRPQSASNEPGQGRDVSRPRTGRTSREGRSGGTESGALEPPPQIDEDLRRQH